MRGRSRPGPHSAAEVPAEVPTDTDTRADALLSRLRALFVDLSGVDPAILTPDANFLELGFDSLLLTQATNALCRSSSRPR